ncbi:hypothetical protein C2S53_005055 [Perilla frutescens var. hirtella]|uniref:CCHC-type domain-containing protein n=1 Tax=Perilla frutescens var. hirtella TaxID=608512 RepID=A0AAD4P8H2_PERFH|nr:hypothetical protein C2S53_005055 [Perilla frutescens var. hirtella]
MKKGTRSESISTPPFDPQSTIPPLDPSKAPMESSSDPPAPWDPKYHFEALSKHVQRQHQALSDKIDGLLHALERTKTTPVFSQAIRGPNRRLEHQNEPEEEYFDENTDAGDDTPDCGRRQRRGNYNDDYGEDRMLNNIKMSIPEFEGLHDPDVYLDWERKFRGYAATWWEMQQERRRINRNPPIDNWEEMKGFMRGRFIPVHYESMNPDIACEVELKEFTSIERMVQYASIVEKQLREGRRRSSQTSAPNRQSWSKASRRPESTPWPPFQRPNQPNPTPNSAPSRARDIQCHKCQGWGHFQNQCPNRRVLFLNEQNGLESASEDEEEPQVAAAEAVDIPEVEPEDEETELPHPLTPKDVVEDQERMQERFKQERTKQAAAAVRTAAVNGRDSAESFQQESSSKSTNAAPLKASNDALVRGKSSGSAPTVEQNRSLFISVKGVEKALKAGPITRLRAKKLQDYLQATSRKKLEEEDGVQSSSKLMILLTLEDGDQDMENTT